MLNKIPVLDKGYIALHSCAPDGKDAVQLSKDFFRGNMDTRIFDITHVNIQIKCPLFVQMTFPEHGLKYVVQRAQGNPEAFVPTIAEVNAMSLEASQAIQADIEQTTAALLINPKAYQMEHCDLFVSQVISPISVYTTLMVSGNLSSWLSYIDQNAFPSSIESYRKAIHGAIFAEYSSIINRKNKIL